MVDRDSDINGVIRAFWRRIEPFKNDYNKELPKDLPVEFRAHFNTALTILDHQIDGEAQRMIDLTGVEMSHDDAVRIIKTGYRLVAEK